MSEDKNDIVEFDSKDASVESTDINPQEINENPAFSCL